MEINMAIIYDVVVNASNKSLAVQQVVLYINVAIGLMVAFAMLTWRISSAQIMHEEDPNRVAALEVRRKYGIISAVIGVSIFSIVNSIHALLGFSYM